MEHHLRSFCFLLSIDIFHYSLIISGFSIPAKPDHSDTDTCCNRPSYRVRNHQAGHQKPCTTTCEKINDLLFSFHTVCHSFPVYGFHHLFVTFQHHIQRNTKSVAHGYQSLQIRIAFFIFPIGYGLSRYKKELSKFLLCQIMFLPNI